MDKFFIIHKYNGTLKLDAISRENLFEVIHKKLNTRKMIFRAFEATKNGAVDFIKNAAQYNLRQEAEKLVKETQVEFTKHGPLIRF